MARDFDSQLLESVAVRRRRLRGALLYGPLRSRRGWDENLGKAFGGLILAAVLCAGCVGWSFVTHRLMHRTSPGTAPAPSPAAATASATVSAQ